MKLLEYETIPCWYEIGFQEKPLAVVIRIAEEIIPFLPRIQSNAPLVKHFLDWGFASFEPDYTKHFGFDESLRFKKRENGFVILECKIPRIRELTGKPCTYCKGSGKDSIGAVIGEKRACGHCKGSGKGYELNWTRAYAVSASLATLLSMLEFPDTETKRDIPQLMIHRFYVGRELHGGSLGGVFSPEFTRWLLSFGQNDQFMIPEVDDVMRRVYAKMLGAQNRYTSYEFRSWIQNGGLVTNCPGNACGLHPESWESIESKRGQKYSCHNVDSPMQQLTLFSGLCYLHDRARRELPNQ